MADKGEDPRIRRARLSGPEVITKDATVAEIAADGKMIILAKGSNEWVCTPGDENKIGDPPMCMNPMGMQWMMDAMQGKSRPTNTAPGLIYMLCGATQRSNTNPADRTSPAIPIGPHWMITWPINAAANGLPTTVRDRGAWVMFAGTPYEYLHICGDPNSRGVRCSTKQKTLRCSSSTVQTIISSHRRIRSSSKVAPKPKSICYRTLDIVQCWVASRSCRK
jgi:hypothetical protein